MQSCWVLNGLKSTEFEITCCGTSKLCISSIILSIELLLVYYEDGQEGLFREQKRQLSPWRKACSIVTGEWREGGAGNSGLERPEETRLQWGHLNSSGWDQMRESAHPQSAVVSFCCQ